MKLLHESRESGESYFFEIGSSCGWTPSVHDNVIHTVEVESQNVEKAIYDIKEFYIDVEIDEIELMHQNGRKYIFDISFREHCRS